MWLYILCNEIIDPKNNLYSLTILELWFGEQYARMTGIKLQVYLQKTSGQLQQSSQVFVSTSKIVGSIQVNFESIPKT